MEPQVNTSAPAPAAPSSPPPSAPSPPPSSPPQSPADSPVAAPPSPPAQPSHAEARSQLSSALDAIETAPAPAAAPNAAPASAPGAVAAPPSPGAVPPPAAAQAEVPAPGQPPAAPLPPKQAAKPEWFAKFAQELGVNADNWKPEDLIGQVKATIQSAAGMERELVQLRQQVALRQSAPGQAAPVVPAEAVKPKAWFETAPEYDPRWESQIKRDDEGKLIVDPGVDPAIIGKLAAWNAHRLDAVNRFAKDPAGTIQEIMGSKIEEMARQVSQGAIQQENMRATAESIYKTNSPWVYSTNPLTGQRTTTPVGQAYIGYVESLSNQVPGMPPTEMDTLARKLAYADMKIAEESGRQPAAPPQGLAAQFAQPAAAPQQAAPPQQAAAPGWQPASLAQPAAPPPPPSNGFTQLGQQQAAVAAGYPAGRPRDGLNAAFASAGFN